MGDCLWERQHFLVLGITTIAMSNQHTVLRFAMNGRLYKVQAKTKGGSKDLPLFKATWPVVVFSNDYGEKWPPSWERFRGDASRIAVRSGRIR